MATSKKRGNKKATTKRPKSQIAGTSKKQTAAPKQSKSNRAQKKSETSSQNMLVSGARSVRSFLGFQLSALSLKALGRFALLWLIPYLILMAFFFSEILSNNNYLEVFPGELIFPAAMHACTAIVIAVTINLLRKPSTFAGKTVSALIMGFLMVNYDARLMSVVPTFRAVIPILPKADGDIPLISLIFVVLLFVAAAFVGQLVSRLQTKRPQASNTNLAGAVLIVVGFLFVGQAWPVYKTMRIVAPQSAYQPTSELNEAAQHKTGQPTGEKPDIYYIVLDRYTNNTVLKEQFGFDNSEFLNNLRSQGFTVNDNAYSNYPYTTSSIASVLNMSYHNDDVAKFKDDKVNSATLFHNMIRQSQVIKLLKEQGYSYHHIGTWYGATNRAPLADEHYIRYEDLELFGKRKQLRSVETFQFKASPYYRMATNVSAPWWPAKLAELDRIGLVRNQLSALEALSKEKSVGGRFIFAHMLVPHDPYSFNQDGSINTDDGSDEFGKPIKEKYLAQVKFINERMKRLVDNIESSSAGKAVVVMVADEGPYPSLLNMTFEKPVSSKSSTDIILDTPMDTWPAADLRMKYGTLNAVKIPRSKATEDPNISAGPNIFREVLNSYFGYSLSKLPNCQLLLPDGRRKLYLTSYENAQFGVPRVDACNMLP